MKILRILPMRRPSARAFTLIELLVVISIIALLAALSVGAFSMAMQTSARNRTTSTLQAVISAMERYKEANGEYPDLKTPDVNHSLTTTDGAQMLYQAITGDGYDQISLASVPVGANNAVPNHSASNGTVDKNFTASIINGDFIAYENPPGSGTFKAKLNSTLAINNKYYIVDGFGHPFQYDKAPILTNGAVNNTTVNPTFDLWSYGNIGLSDPTSSSLSVKQSATATSIWIKNW